MSPLPGTFGDTSSVACCEQPAAPISTSARALTIAIDLIVVAPRVIVSKARVEFRSLPVAPSIGDDPRPGHAKSTSRRSRTGPCTDPFRSRPATVEAAPPQPDRGGNRNCRRALGKAHVAEDAL